MISILACCWVRQPPCLSSFVTLYSLSFVSQRWFLCPPPPASPFIAFHLVSSFLGNAIWGLCRSMCGKYRQYSAICLHSTSNSCSTEITRLIFPQKKKTRPLCERVMLVTHNAVFSLSMCLRRRQPTCYSVWTRGVCRHRFGTLRHFLPIVYLCFIINYTVLPQKLKPRNTV